MRLQRMKSFVVDVFGFKSAVLSTPSDPDAAHAARKKSLLKTFRVYYSMVWYLKQREAPIIQNVPLMDGTSDYS